MDRVFVDSSAFVGIFNADDSLHGAAHAKSQTLSDLRARSATSYAVIDESATVLSQRASKERACKFLDWALKENGPELLAINEYLWHEAYGLFRSVTNKNISMVDCQIVALCREHAIKTIFTFDKHFAKLGLTVL